MVTFPFRRQVLSVFLTIMFLTALVFPPASVGAYPFYTPSGGRHSFVSQNGTTTDLNTVGSEKSTATAIQATVEASPPNGNGGRGKPGVSASASYSVVMSPTSLDFGSQQVSTRSAGQILTLTNTGTQTITWYLDNSGNFGPNGSGFITTAQTCTTADFQPGTSCTVTIAFAPTTVGRIGASWFVYLFDTGEHLATASLSGTGTPGTPPPSSSPTITRLDPISIAAGGGDLVLWVYGTNFVTGVTGDPIVGTGTTVRWNGAPRFTRAFDSTVLQAVISAADIATPGTASVTVANPDGGISNALAFTINNPAPPSPPPSATYTLTLSTAGTNTGSVYAAPWPGPFAAGTVVTLIPQPAAGTLFTGWTVDGQPAGWAPHLTITMHADHAVTANFAARPVFGDVSTTNSAYDAIEQLAGRSVIRGCDQAATPPLFCSDDLTLRAQMAALIARAMGWDTENHSNFFPDQGGVDNDLWRNVGTLNFYNVAHGYSDQATCASAGVSTPCYLPRDNVTYAQTISFITRAMVAKGYWQQQTDNPQLFPEIPRDSGHRDDLATYVHYAGSIVGAESVQVWSKWGQPAPRSWFAQALWQALDRYGLVAWPFNPADGQWAIVNGYRGALDHAPGQSPNNYALYAFDFAKCQPDNVVATSGECNLTSGWAPTTGATIYSPVSGTIAWEDRGCFSVAIDIDNKPGYRIVLAHINSSPATGTRVSQGDVLGTVSDGACIGQGNHIHIALYYQPDISADPAASRIGVPFSGEWGISGCDYSDDRITPNQYLGRLAPCR